MKMNITLVLRLVQHEDDHFVFSVHIGYAGDLRGDICVEQITGTTTWEHGPTIDNLAYLLECNK